MCKLLGSATEVHSPDSLNSLLPSSVANRALHRVVDVQEPEDSLTEEDLALAASLESVHLFWGDFVFRSMKVADFPNSLVKIFESFDHFLSLYKRNYFRYLLNFVLAQIFCFPLSNFYAKLTFKLYI